MQAIEENNILKMYVDENVLKFMNHKEFEITLLKNEVIEASVMFIDICGFTAITENISADAVVGLINRIFDNIVKEVINNGGDIDKFMANDVMAETLTCKRIRGY